MLSIFSQLIFGSSSVFSGAHGTGTSSSSWKEKSLCFDLRKQDLEMSQGEQLIACFFPIEDVKGNQEEFGILKVTNLRLIWICCDRRRVNFSIGWRTVTLTFEQKLRDALGSVITTLCVLTKHDSTKYEFVFNKMSTESGVWLNNHDIWSDQTKYEKFLQAVGTAPQVSHLSPIYLDEPYEVIFEVWQSYKKTHLFRHCRSNISHLLTIDPDKQSTKAKLGEISKLPSEEIIDIYSNITNIETRAIRYTGSLILTNIRLIWIDDLLPMRNLSIPYLRIDSMKYKHDDRIVICTLDYLATSNQVELRSKKVDSNFVSDDSTQKRKLKQIFEQMQNLFTLYKGRPKFGPESTEECLRFMSNLRPVEQYFETLNDMNMQKIKNLGIKEKPKYLIDESLDETSDDVLVQKPYMETLDDEQSNIDDYNCKMNSYLINKPIERDEELIYCEDIGLTIEKPLNNKDLSHIWKMNL